VDAAGFEAAVVGEEEDDGVLQEAVFFKLLKDAADVAALIEARRWDHHIPGLVEAAEPLADAAVARGEAAAAEEAWEEAYAAFSEALRLDPSRSWARRHAETARDHVLGIAPAEDEEEADEAEAPAEVGGDG
jgi:hypothetical protein